MTWLGGFAVFSGVLLILALGVRVVLLLARHGKERMATKPSYARRLEPAPLERAGDQVDVLAQELIAEHGADAVFEAARRALADLDDAEGKSRAVWRRVLELAERGRPPSAVTESRVTP